MTALDAVETLPKEEAQVLVVTNECRFFSKGRDLQSLDALEATAELREARRRGNLLCVRLLTFPLPTVAAVQLLIAASG